MKTIKDAPASNAAQVIKKNSATKPAKTITKGAVKPAPDEVKLTKRSPGELLAMQFDPDELLFDNGMLSKGHPLTFLGQGGLGKSRLLMQMAVCSITGVEFLGWKPSKKRCRWLVIQAENNNRRIQGDLRFLKEWVGDDLWKHVDENLVIHPVEKMHDSYLNVNERVIRERIAALVQEVKADVVLFDPLAAFALGNLNSDAAMTKTCRALMELARLGNEKAAIIIAHHTLTGKQGIAKATGFDAASYGRGSKALHAFTRAQLNIAPAHPLDNTKLVVGCGKNNDGANFPPFGIRLNTTTMIYEVDAEFDHDAWRAEFDGGEVHHKVTKEEVAALVKDLPRSRKDLVMAIIDETGCKKSTAYNAVKAAEGKTIEVDENRQLKAIVQAAQ